MYVSGSRGEKSAFMPHKDAYKTGFYCEIIRIGLHNKTEYHLMILKVKKLVGILDFCDAQHPQKPQTVLKVTSPQRVRHCKKCSALLTENYRYYN